MRNTELDLAVQLNDMRKGCLGALPILKKTVDNPLYMWSPSFGGLIIQKDSFVKFLESQIEETTNMLKALGIEFDGEVCDDE